jgi:predicted amidohydrolase
MEDVKLAVAQFSPVRLEKEANLSVIEDMTEEAVERGAEIVCFQEQSIPGYNLWGLPGSRERDDGSRGVEPGRVPPAWNRPGVNPQELAERVPDGPSTQRLLDIARKTGAVVMAGLIERRPDNACYNSYVIVSPRGYIGRYSKCHCVPGVEYAYFKQGNAFPVFDLGKLRVGVLICYDNHFPEAHRIYAVRGAHAIIMPHVTAGRAWWHDLPTKEADTQARNWVLTWLRARAFDNSVYAAFVNQADGGDNGCRGCSMILNPEGDVVAECATPGRDLAVAGLSADTYRRVRGRTHDYVAHRRPELYGDLCRTDIGETGG